LQCVFRWTTQVGAGTELKAINTLLKRQSDIVGATVTHRSLADIKAAMLSIIQSQLDWQRSLDDMFEFCGVDTRMTVRGKALKFSKNLSLKQQGSVGASLNDNLINWPSSV